MTAATESAAFLQGRSAGLASVWRYTRNPHYGEGADVSAAADWNEGYRDGAREANRLNLEWTRRMNERFEPTRGVTQEAKSAAWGRMRAVEKEARATAPTAEPAEGVVVASPNTSSRHYSYKVIHGPRAGALAFCSHVFATDSCTPMYEHMLWKMFGADEHEDGTVTLWLSKSNYAGD